MLRFYDAWAERIIGSDHPPRRAERWNDQAAVHRIYQNRSRYRSNANGVGFSLRLDSACLFSLQLWKCEGRKWHTKKPFEYCHEKPFEPAQGVRTEDGGRTTIYTDSHGVEQRPFLVHSNGHHHVMSREETHLRPLLDLYDPAPSELLDYPVILVDSFEYGPCAVASIGWLMNSTRWPTGAPRKLVGDRRGDVL